MATQYEFKLVAMAWSRSRAGSPGDMSPGYVPIDEERRDLLFIFRDNLASFESMKNEHNNLKPEDMKAWFMAFGSQLKMEVYTNNVYIESPPSDDVPRDLFKQMHLPSSLTKPPTPREIYLRPGDTVIFEDEGCSVNISVTDANSRPATSSTHGADAAEIQVKSSARQSFATHSGAEPEPPVDDEDTEDEDDLDASVNTPAGMDDATPATSRPTGPAVQDTPARPVSRESNLMYSTAPDSRTSQHPDNANGVDRSTPPARAGAEKGKRTKVKASDEGDSQFVFPNAKGQVTYGGTPRQKRQSASRDEIFESPAKDDNTGDTRSSPGRKRSFDEGEDECENEHALPASTAPPNKKPRGRPPKAQKSLAAPQKKTEPALAESTALTKNGKTRRRPRKTSVAEAEETISPEQPSSTGKLKRPGRQSVLGADNKVEAEEDEEMPPVDVVNKRSNLSPDLDPRPSSTPQSSGTAGKAPTKVLLSSSTYGKTPKAKTWLKNKGAAVVEKIPGKRTNFVCVVRTGELPTTAKVVRSLALGKKVVTDQWITDSMEQGQLLDLDEYVHDDLTDNEVNRSKLFEGRTIFVTHALVTKYGAGFADIKELAGDVGARQVETGSLKKASAPGTIILGAEGNDADALKLTQEEGLTVYQKDLLTQSIIRGALLCNDDVFQWKPAATGKGKKGKK